MSSPAPAAGRPWLLRALDALERVGNLLPHPASLFVILAAVVVVLSAVLHAQGVSVTNPASGAVVEVTNLLSVAGVQRLVMGLLPNFINFAPFGPVLVCLLGLSVAEHSGFLGAVVRVIIGATPARLLTLVVVFTGATSSTAGDVGYVLLLPLSAALFHSAGRNPLTGLAAAFSGVSGGFAANLLLSPTDVILAGLTQEAARLVDPAAVITPMASYYFLATSVFLITITGTLVTELVVEPRLGTLRRRRGPRTRRAAHAARVARTRWSAAVARGAHGDRALRPRAGRRLPAGSGAPRVHRVVLPARAGVLDLRVRRGARARVRRDGGLHPQATPTCTRACRRTWS